MRWALRRRRVALLSRHLGLFLHEFQEYLLQITVDKKTAKACEISTDLSDDFRTAHRLTTAEWNILQPIVDGCMCLQISCCSSNPRDYETWVQVVIVLYWRLQIAKTARAVPRALNQEVSSRAPRGRPDQLGPWMPQQRERCRSYNRRGIWSKECVTVEICV